ncbi:MAG: hypothetical protein HQ541_20720 [Mariniphaga sp.]|nr:hypothetical protein [Mariniphaga sp.]
MKAEERTNINLKPYEISNLDSESLKDLIVRLRFKCFMDCGFLNVLEFYEASINFRSELDEDISYLVQYPFLFLKNKALKLKKLYTQINEFIKSNNLVNIHALFESDLENFSTHLDNYRNSPWNLIKKDNDLNIIYLLKFFVQTINYNTKNEFIHYTKSRS